MKIAVIGQSMFGAETYSILRKNGHKIVGVFTVPDVGGKPDPLGDYKSVHLNYFSFLNETAYWYIKMIFRFFEDTFASFFFSK